jgi:hypothetical protein
MKNVLQADDGSMQTEDAAGEQDVLFVCPCANCQAYATDVSKKILLGGITETRFGGPSTPTAYRAGAIRAAVVMTVANPQHAGRSRDQLFLTWMRLAAEMFEQTMGEDGMERIERSRETADALLNAVRSPMAPSDGKVH